MKLKDHFLTEEQFEIVETNIEGIWKTEPVPTNIGKYYESEKYISHHQDSGSLKERVYKFLQNFNLTYKKDIVSNYVETGGTILDYGCGAGEFIKKVQDQYITFGFEPNEKARSFAQQKAKKTTLISDIESIPDGSLHAISLWHVFEHIEKQEEILSVFYKKLKTGGKLIIAVPNPTSYDALHYKEFWAAFDVPRHLFHFSKNGMETLMNNKNWRLIKIKPLLLDSFYISMLSEKYKKSSLFWLKGMIHGAISNIKASKSGEFSSLIYIIEKK